ncbi:MAG: hypothetical protein ACREMY_26295, partial [bacterium]
SYRPPRDFRVHYDIAREMTRLRENGCTAREIIQRLTEVYALAMTTARFRTAKELAHALGRNVLKLRSRAGQKPNGVLVRYLGNILKEDLGSFCTALFARVESDGDVRAKAKQAFRDGWTIRGES